MQKIIYAAINESEQVLIKIGVLFVPENSFYGSAC